MLKSTIYGIALVDRRTDDLASSTLLSTQRTLVPVRQDLQATTPPPLIGEGTTSSESQCGLQPPWQPGQSGNPAGRPRGSRNRLGEAFVDDLCADWKENGPQVIVAVRKADPSTYLRVVASILPKELSVTKGTFDDVSDDELLGLLAILRSMIAEEDQKAPANGNPESGEIEPGGTPKLISSNVMQSDEKEHFTEGQRGLSKKLDQ